MNHFTKLLDELAAHADGAAARGRFEDRGSAGASFAKALEVNVPAILRDATVQLREVDRSLTRHASWLAKAMAPTTRTARLAETKARGREVLARLAEHVDQAIERGELTAADGARFDNFHEKMRARFAE